MTSSKPNFLPRAPAPNTITLGVGLQGMPVGRTPPPSQYMHSAHNTFWLSPCSCSFAQSCLTLWPDGPHPAKVLCPWDCSGKNTGVCCHFFLQGILLTQGWDPCLPALQVDALPLSHQGSLFWLYSSSSGGMLNLKKVPTCDLKVTGCY